MAPEPAAGSRPLSLLNLHSRDPDPQPEPEDQIVLPETPPGLDAIRAWLTKPRPWLHGVRLWIHWLLSGPPAAYTWLKEQSPRIRRTLHRIAAEGTLVRRILERVGNLLRETADGTEAAFRAFRDPRGERERESGELDHLPETVRRLGQRVTLGARLVTIVVSILKRLAELFPETPTTTAPDPDPVPDNPPDDTPPPPPAPTPDPTPDPGPEPPPKPEPKLSPKPEPKPDPRHAPRHEPQPPSLPSGEPQGAKEEEEAEGKPPPDPPEPDTGSPEPDPDTAPPDTDPPEPDPPPETPPIDWDARLEGLPPILHKWVRDLGKRPRRDSLHALILKICSVREWTTSEDLARFLGMHQHSLVARHLSDLVDAGLLKLKHPERPKHPRQAYRSTPKAAAHM